MITNKIKKYKIDIGNHPKSRKFGDATISEYEAILNVSDYPPYRHADKSIELHWCPIVEWDDWGYAPLYWTVNLLDDLIAEKKKIYVHCWAGKHRSPMLVYLYLRSLGHSEVEAFKLYDTQFELSLEGEQKKPIGNWLKRFYNKDIKKKRIPKDSIKFMKLVRKHPELSILEVLEILHGKKINYEFNLVLGDKK